MCSMITMADDHLHPDRELDERRIRRVEAFERYRKDTEKKSNVGSFELLKIVRK